VSSCSEHRRAQRNSSASSTGPARSFKRLCAQHPDARIVWVTLNSDEVRAEETRAAAARLLAGAYNTKLVIKTFRQSYFPFVGAELKDFFETLKAEIVPDIVFTHRRDDMHQDHRVVNEFTWNTFRNHLILEYEIPKYEGDLCTPNVYVPLTRDEIDAKIDMLMNCFPSQHSRQWFTPETFMAIARLRGIECNAQGGFAEGFHCRKLVLAI
jgi:LmbE family N-acetylglucosaminyl deacetylase